MSLFTDSILISTPCLPCKQHFVTSNTGPVLVFPRIQPFGSDDFSSLGKVYSRQATESVKCENSSVSFLMKYCPTPTVVKNPASIQNLTTRFYCKSLSTRSWYFCNRSSCEGFDMKIFVLGFFWFAHFDHELLDFTDKLQCSGSWEIYHSSSNGSPSIVSKVLYCDESLNHPNSRSQTVFDVGFWFIFPRHNTESENTQTPLHAEDWWFLHYWPVTTVSTENFPSWFEILQKSHLNVPMSTVQISRTSALKWDFPLYF